MSTRTPGVQDRSQYHSYWGVYANGTTALPNQSANPLSSPGEFDKLEAGDIAYSSGTPGLFVCVSPGGASATPAATWSALGSGGAATIRDAHQVVVGQTGGVYTDVVGVDADYVDTGDGAQLQLALTAAGALIGITRLAVDVRLRPCRMTLVATFLTLTQGVNLIGVDGGSIIRGSGTLIRITGGGANVIEQLTLEVTADGESASLENGAIDAQTALAGLEVRRCHVNLSFTVVSPTTMVTRSAIYLSQLTGMMIVEDNLFEMANFLDVAGALNPQGWGLTVAQDTGVANGIRSFRNNRLFGGGMCYVTCGGSSDSMVGWEIANNQHANAGANPVGSAAYIITMEYDAAAPGVGEGPFQGPKIVGNQITTRAGAAYSEGEPSGYIRVGDVAADANARNIVDTVIANNILRNPLPLDKILNNAIDLTVNSLGTGQIQGVVIEGNQIQGSDGGIRMGAGPSFNAAVSVQTVAITGNVIDIGDNSGSPVRAIVGGIGNVLDVVVSGNSMRAQTQVQSTDAGNTNWIVIANRMAGGAPGMVTDASGTWDVAHNIVT